MVTSPILTFDVAQFRAEFPEFANATTFPDVTLQMYWDNATCYVSDVNCGTLAGECRQLALNLMTAHLTKLSQLILAGQTPGLVQNATVDKVTVGLTPPPLRSEWQWWLMTTPYGMQLLALLQGRSVGGFYVGGLPETSAFRRVGGVYTRGFR